MIARPASPATRTGDAAAAVFSPGKPNRCTSCGGTSWHIGRVVAECAACGLPALLAAPPHLTLKGH